MNLNKKSDPSFDDLMLSATANYLRLSKSIIVLKSVFFVPFFSSESTCDCKDHACNVKIENGGMMGSIFFSRNEQENVVEASRW